METNFISEKALINCNGHKVKHIKEGIEKNPKGLVLYVQEQQEIEEGVFHTRYMAFKRDTRGLLFGEMEGTTKYNLVNKNIFSTMDYPTIVVEFTEEGLLDLLKVVDYYNKYTAKKPIELNALKTLKVKELTVSDFHKIAKVFEHYYWLDRKGLGSINPLAKYTVIN